MGTRGTGLTGRAVATTTASAPSSKAGTGTRGAAPTQTAGDRALRTPTRLWIALAAAAAAILAVAVTGATTLAARQATETHTVNSAEHLVVNVHELYNSLADA